MVSFWEACGAVGPIVLEIDGPDDRVSSRRVFEQPAIRIGASRNADLVLKHPGVSRRHVYLQVIEGHLFSINLSRRADAPTGWIQPFDWFAIGPFRLRAQIGEVLTPAEIPEGLPSPLSRDYARRRAYPAAALGITADHGIVDSYPVTRVLTLIGRAPTCKIRLQAAGASLYYGALVRTPRGPWFVDLLSSQGVAVNGRRVRQAPLRDGDRLQVDRYELRLGLTDSDDRDHQIQPLKGPLETQRALRPPSPLTNTSTSGGILEPATQPVLDQIASMRQELGDQFQQALLMISQLFGAMHNDHMRVVHEELEQVRILTQEIQALRADPPRPAEPGPTVVDASAGNPELAAPAGSTGGPSPHAPPRRVRHDPQEIEALVSERLARFEAERQGRWGRILQVLEDLRKRGLGSSAS